MDSLAANDAGAVFLAVVIVAVVLTLYFTPSIIAKSRDHHQFATILVLNIFLGWTFIGWVVCLAMALSATNKGGTPVTQVGPPPPSPATVPAGWYSDLSVLPHSGGGTAHDGPTQPTRATHLTKRRHYE